MKRTSVPIATREPSVVRIGPGVLDEIGERVGARCTAVLTDRNVAPLHGHRLGLENGTGMLAVEPGEGSKCLASLELVLAFMADAGLDRRSLLVTLGGGVVGDLGGLAASLYMRGIAVVHAPTTLLAQVDAAIGGKTAVNLPAGKNMAGSFHTPEAVFCDTDTLATLPLGEVRNGLGEALKTAFVGDAGLFDLLEERGAETQVPGGGDAALSREVVERCVRVKGGIVERDEREAGERKKLNLGHTFAHAIERAGGYGVIPHGRAVVAGLGLALAASERVGLLHDADLIPRFERVASSLGLAPTLHALREEFAVSLPADELLRAMTHDKKGAAGRPAFVLVEGLEKLRVGCEVEPELLAELLA